MKPAITKYAKTPKSPAFKGSIKKPGAIPKKAAPNPTPQKRENIFSKSRDTREDRSARQMKTEHNPQTFPHAR